jgi:hypothetical protein
MYLPLIRPLSLYKGVVSLDENNLVAYYYSSASENLPGKRDEL